MEIETLCCRPQSFSVHLSIYSMFIIFAMSLCTSFKIFIFQGFSSRLKLKKYSLFFHAIVLLLKFICQTHSGKINKKGSALCHMHKVCAMGSVQPPRVCWKLIVQLK